MALSKDFIQQSKEELSKLGSDEWLQLPVGDEGTTLSRYSGGVGGAHVTVFAPDSDGDLCVLVLPMDQKMNSEDRIACFPEGVRPAPAANFQYDVKALKLAQDAVESKEAQRQAKNQAARTQLEQAGVALTDEEMAYKIVAAKSGVVLDADALIKYDYKNPEGKEHLNVWVGDVSDIAQDKSALPNKMQNVGFFYADLPEVKPTNDNAIWVKVKDITSPNGSASASKMAFNTQSLALSPEQTHVLYAAAQELVKKRVSEANRDLPQYYIDGMVDKGFPKDDIASLDNDMSDMTRRAKATHVTIAPPV